MVSTSNQKHAGMQTAQRTQILKNSTPAPVTCTVLLLPNWNSLKNFPNVHVYVRKEAYYNGRFLSNDPLQIVIITFYIRH